jgi:hypothetical protein
MFTVEINCESDYLIHEHTLDQAKKTAEKFISDEIRPFVRLVENETRMVNCAAVSECEIVQCGEDGGLDPVRFPECFEWKNSLDGLMGGDQ